MFHPVLLRWGGSVKFLTIRKRQRFESIATSWAVFLTQTQVYLRQGSLRSPLVQLRSYVAGSISAAHSGTDQLPGRSGPACPCTHIQLPAHPYYLQCAHSYRTTPGLSWATRFRGWNELFGQLRGCVQNDMRAYNDVVLNRHRRDKTCTQDIHVLLPLNHQIMFGLHLFIITWLFFTIANIANHDQVSTYIAGDRKSLTSTSLSMAKHITTYSY
jgi:hypothetical protein